MKRQFLSQSSLIIMLVLSICPASAKVFHVNASAIKDGFGSSWADAIKNLQSALGASQSGDEIWVAVGTYKPTNGTDRTISFQLKGGVALYGGFNGTEATHEERDWAANETVLSGDIGIQGNNSDNSYIVVRGADDAVIDGFTIRDGHANGGNAERRRGGGMANDGTSATVRNCSFVSNFAKEHGAAMLNYGAHVVVTNCAFLFNSSDYYGGAIFNDRSNNTVSNCRFYGNTALHAGGAILNFVCDTVITSCEFVNNSIRSSAGISQGGGGIWIARGNHTLSNCIFSGNKADAGPGAAIFCTETDVPATLSAQQCTFVGNKALESATVVVERGTAVQIQNCILRNDGTEIIADNGSDITLIFSNIKGGKTSLVDPYGRIVWGNGNIDVDPSFVDPGYWDNDVWVNGDYHLKSEAGRYDPAIQSWVYDDVTSPCIDAGNPASPVGAEPFCNGGIVNMGAYGGTAEASKTVSTLTMLYPNGGEILPSARDIEITWASIGCVDNVTLSYALETGTHAWHTIDTVPNNGLYVWTTPATASSTVFLRIEDSADVNVSDQINDPFVVYEVRTVTLLYPNGGESIPSSRTTPIRWDSTGPVTHVLLEYSTDLGNTWLPICLIPNTHSYAWTPASGTLNSVLIRIQDYTTASVFDISDGVFSIYACPKFLLTDVNQDCYVDLADLAAIASEWLICGNPSDPSCGVSAEYAYNGSFEDTDRLAIGFPQDTGYWGGDLHRIVGETQGITPCHGAKMLQFIASRENEKLYTPHTNTGNATASDIEQRIRVYPSAVIDGNTKIVMTAYFNRVHTDEQTDTKFEMEIIAYSQQPHSMFSLNSVKTEIMCDSDPATWEELSAELMLPQTTGFVKCRLSARENIYDDVILYGEFDGHFADAVSIFFIKE